MSVIAREASITVDFEEDESSPKETYGQDGFTAVRTLLCDWPNRHTLATQLRGSIEFIGTDTVWRLPAKYPHGFPDARVLSVEVEGMGKPDSLGSSELFEKAKLIVNYGILKSEEETLYEERIEPASEFLTLPVNNLYWGTGESKVALKDTEAPGMLIRMFDWVYTLKNVQNIPTWLGNIEGCTNSDTVKSKTLGLTFSPETILIGQPDASRVVTTYGDKAWQLTFRFTCRRLNWNKFPRLDMAGANGIPFEYITNGTNAIKVFPQTAISGIIL
jgi:hypothetical protein